MNDSELFLASEQFIKRELSNFYNEAEDVLILSVSRKGPKFLERIFGRTESSSLNVITEVALPFCMKRLACEKKNWKIKVFDDAVYYGTTIEGIVHELEEFERLYDIKSDKELYTAIRAKESHANFKNNLKNVDIHSCNDDLHLDLRNGYGHYFIRRLERELADANNTLEIEFPIFEFDTDNNLDINRLFRSIVDAYGEEKCYSVDHHGQISFTIVLDKSPGQSFNKIRIYAKENIIRVVGMAPWLLPNDMPVILSLFDDSPFIGIWHNLMSAYIVPPFGRKRLNPYSFMYVERSIRKSLVILANYLLSCGFLIKQKDKIIEIFNRYGSSVRYKGIRSSDLFYLVGDISLCRQIQSKVDELWRRNLAESDLNLAEPNCVPPNSTIDYQVFEQSNFLDQKEVDIFERHNNDMLDKCKDVNEALSAMFYNQTALIEKWSRRNEAYDFGRLRFGYTYSSLKKDLYDRNKIDDKIKSIKDIHKWIDHRIDQACIVPQYVVDHKTNFWCRVFRPGENEDALLSHLARYVLSIFNCLNNVQKLGWIYKVLFEELLCLSAYNIEELKDCFEFELDSDVSERKLMFKYSDNSSKRNVFEYLTEMKILKVENDMVSVSKDLADDDLKNATTLDFGLENKIHAKIYGVMEQVVNLKYQQFPFFVTNLYFSCNSQIAEIANYNRSYYNSLDKDLDNIENGALNVNEIPNELYENYIGSKKYIVSIDILNNDDIMSSQFPDEKDKLKFVREMIVMWMIKFMYELLIISQLNNNPDVLKKEIDTARSYNVYDYDLEWDDEMLHAFQELIENTNDMTTIREKSLSLIRKKMTLIPKVKL